MTLQKPLKIISILGICLLGACASGSDPAVNAQANDLDAAIPTQASPQESAVVKGERAETMSQAKLDSFPVKMWQAKPGSPIYNPESIVVNSLRLQSSVMVQAIEGEKAILNKETGNWVYLSDLVNEDPQVLLGKPIDSNGMPRISVEEMMKMKPKGDGN